MKQGVKDTLRFIFFLFLLTMTSYPNGLIAYAGPSGQIAECEIIDTGNIDSPSYWSLQNDTIIQFSNIWGGSEKENIPVKPGTYLIWGNEKWNDYTLSLDLKSGDDDSIGILFRYKDENNYYRFSMDKDRKFQRLIKKSGGFVSIIAEKKQGYIKNKWYHLKADILNDKMQIYIDNRLVIESSDNSIANGKIGLYCWGNKNSEFKNITIVPKNDQPVSMIGSIKKAQQKNLLSAQTQKVPSTALVKETSASENSLKPENNKKRINIPPNQSKTIKINTEEVLLPFQGALKLDISDCKIFDEGINDGPSSWYAFDGVLSQESNIWGGSSTSKSAEKPGTYAIIGNKNWSNHILSVDLRSQDDGAIGVMFRYKDKNNYYRFSIDGQNKYRRLIKKTNGNTTILAEDAKTWKPGQWRNVKIQMRNDTISVFIDNEYIFSTTDDTLSIGKIGLYCWGNENTEFKNIQMASISTSEPTTQQAPLKEIVSKIKDSQKKKKTAVPLKEITPKVTKEKPVVIKTPPAPEFKPKLPAKEETKVPTPEISDNSTKELKKIEEIPKKAVVPIDPQVIALGYKIIDEGDNKTPSIWSYKNGVLIQSSNIWGGNSSPTDPFKPGTYALKNDKNWTNFNLNAEFLSTDDDGIGFIFRYKDQNNYYRMAFHNQRGYRRLIKKVNGLISIISEDPVPYESNKWYTVKINAVNDNIQIFLDNNLLYNIIDSSLSIGKIGFYCWGNSLSKFKNIDITQVDLPSEPSTESLYKNLSKRQDYHINLENPIVIDEGINNSPSFWHAKERVLIQTSNIWGGDVSSDQPEKPGTMAIYGQNDWTDYIFTTKVYSQDNDELGLIFRFKDADNYYRISMNAQHNYKRFIKKQNGKITVLDTVQTGYKTEKWYDFKVTATGNRLKCYIDNDLVFDEIDDSLKKGKIGFYCWGNENCKFKAINITAPSKTIKKSFGAKKKISPKNSELQKIDLESFSIVDDGKKNGPSSWSVLRGVLTQSTNIWGGEIEKENPEQPGTYAIFGDISLTNYTVTADLRSGDDDSIGILFRYQDKDNYYRFSMNAQQAFRRLVKKVYGKVTILAEDSQIYESGRWYNIKVKLHDDQISIFLDDENIFRARDNSLGAGQIGLYCWGNEKSDFRNITLANHIALSPRKSQIFELADEYREEEDSIKLSEESKDETQKAIIANQKRLAEEARIAEQKRLAEEARIAEQKRLAEKARIAEQERLAEEARIAEQKRLAEEARIAEQKRLAEKARIAEKKRLAEKARIAEQKRLAEEARIAEKKRLAEEARIAEQKRLAEEARIAEQKRLAEEARIAEQKRLAEEARIAEQKRLAEKARIAEQKRLAEKARMAEKKRLAEEARIVEQKRLAETARIAEKKRLAEEARIAKQKRLSEKAKIAKQKKLAKEKEKARKAEEKRLAKEAKLAKKKKNEEKKRLEKEARIAAKAKLAEQKRLAVEAQKTEKLRLKKEAQIAEQKRIQIEAELAEKKRLEEIAKQKKLAEKARIAEQKRIQKEARIAEETRKAEQLRLKKEAQIAEQKRIQIEAELAEKKRLEEIAKQKKLAEKARLAEEKRLAKEKEMKDDKKKRMAELYKKAEKEISKAKTSVPPVGIIPPPGVVLPTNVRKNKIRETVSKVNSKNYAIIDEGTESGPSSWAPTENGMIQYSDIRGGSQLRHKPEKPGTYVVWGENWENYTIEAMIRSSDNDEIGLMFRYLDNNNYYRFSMNSELNYRRLIKKTNGKVTILKEDNDSYRVNKWYAVKILATGNKIEIFIDNRRIFNVNDSSIPDGKIGLYCWANENSEFKDISVIPGVKKPDTQKSNYITIDEGKKEGPSVWTVSNGVLIQSSNIWGGKKSRKNAEKPGTYAIWGDSWVNYSIEATLRSKDEDSIGLMFRYIDKDNYYRFSMNKKLRYRRLIKKVNGKVTILAEDQVSYIKNQWYKIQVTLFDQDIKVFIGNEPIFSVVDDSHSYGKLCFYSWANSGSEYKDIAVIPFKKKSDTIPPPNKSAYKIIDEGKNEGPSAWTVKNDILTQWSNIWGGTKEAGDPDKKGTYALWEESSSDFSITVDIRSRDNDAIGIIFRHKDPDNYYRLAFNRQLGYRRLIKKVNGVIHVLAEDDVLYNKNQWYSVKIIVYENTIDISVNGNHVFKVIDDSISYGQFGFYSWENQGSEFNNIEIKPLSENPFRSALSLSETQFYGKTTIRRPPLLFADNSNKHPSYLNRKGNKSPVGTELKCVGYTIHDEGTLDGPSAWYVTNEGNLVQSSNVYGDNQGPDPINPGTYALGGKTCCRNYKFSCELRSQDDDSFGIMFRYLNNKNYYRFSMNSQQKFRRLSKIVDGNFTIIDEDFVSYIQNQWYLVNIIVMDDNIKIYMDGKLIFNVFDDSLVQGKIGLYCWANEGSEFKNPYIVPLPGTSLPPQTEIAKDEEKEIKAEIQPVVVKVTEFSRVAHKSYTVIDEGTNKGPSSWAVVDGVLRQSSNIWGGKLDTPDPDKPGTYALWGGDWENYAIEGEIKSQDDDSVGIMFRYKDNDNYYRFEMNRQLKFRRLLKKINGKYKILSQDAIAYTQNKWYAIKIFAIKDTLTVFVNGTQIFKVRDSSFKSGMVGLYCWGNENSEFDNFIITPYSKKQLANESAPMNGSSYHIDIENYSVVDEGENNGPSSWSIIDNVLTQKSNIWGGSIKGQSPNKPGTYALYGKHTWKDYGASMKIRSEDDDGIGAMFRYRDKNNYYRIALNKQEGYRRLIKKVNGISTIIAENNKATYTKNIWFTLKIVVVKNKIKIYQDSDLIFDVIDTSISSGKIGLYCWGNTFSEFKDLTIKPIHIRYGASLFYEQIRKVVAGFEAAAPLSFPDNQNKDIQKILLTKHGIREYGFSVYDEGNINSPSNWVISNDVLRQTSNIWGGNDSKRAPVKPGTYALLKKKTKWLDYDLTLKLRSSDDDAIGVLFSYQDRNNYYRFSMDREREYIRLVKKQNGLTTILAQDTFAYEQNKWYHLRTLVSGSSIKIFLDGEIMVDVFDNSLKMGKVGLYCWGNENSEFKEISVTPYQNPKEAYAKNNTDISLERGSENIGEDRSENDIRDQDIVFEKVSSPELIYSETSKTMPETSQQEDTQFTKNEDSISSQEKSGNMLIASLENDNGAQTWNSHHTDISSKKRTADNEHLVKLFKNYNETPPSPPVNNESPDYTEDKEASLVSAESITGGGHQENLSQKSLPDQKNIIRFQPDQKNELRMAGDTVDDLKENVVIEDVPEPQVVHEKIVRTEIQSPPPLSEITGNNFIKDEPEENPVTPKIDSSSPDDAEIDGFEDSKNTEENIMIAKLDSLPDTNEDLIGFEDDAADTGYDSNEVATLEDDALGGFSGDYTSSQSYSQPLSLSVLFEINGHLKLSQTFNIAHKEPEVGQTDWRGLSKLQAEAQLEVSAKFLDTWQGHFVGKGYHDPSYQINGRENYTPEVLEEYENDIEMREAYIEGSLTDKIDLKIGRQIVVWGKSDNIRVTDILNPLDLREPGLTDIEYLRLPLFMGRLVYYISPWTFSLISVFENKFDSIPAYGSDYYPYAIPPPKDKVPKNPEIALSLSGGFKDMDVAFYLSNFYDDSGYLTFEPNGFAIEHPRITMGGITLNRAMGNWLLKGEAAQFLGLMYSNSEEKFSKFFTLIGFEYSGFTNTNICIEFANDYIYNYDINLKNVPDQVDESLFQYALRLSRSFINNTLVITLYAQAYELSFGGGSFERLMAEYFLSDNVKISGSLILYQSGDYTLLQNVDDNDRLFFDIKYSF